MIPEETLTKIAEILAQLNRGNTWSCDTRWLCSQLEAALTERDKLRERVAELEQTSQDYFGKRCENLACAERLMAKLEAREE